ncbi:DNA-binding protein [Klebsiella pneumoniae]|uniref:DNA-binding protein n=1 Tax=Klebsiella pneumoniae TaxID=573 RepID=UPI001C8F5D6F|nr:DNA-binding protein [Klebsiella pneumoniae]
MARQGITFEQVAAVADALAGEGQQPTIRAVREKLGDTGSPNTIHKHLTAWREAARWPQPLRRNCRRR